MAIGTLTPFPTPAPQIGQAPEVFDANASGTLGYLPDFVSDFNLRITETNTELQAYYNAAAQLRSEISTTSVTLSSYVEVANNHKTDAESAKNGAETALNSMTSLLDGLDITATGGYTVDAVDDLISRNRNLNIMGLNLI